MITNLTTTDIAVGLNIPTLYANKPSEKDTAHTYMVANDDPIVPSHTGYLDKILRVRFYFIAAQVPAADKTQEEEIDIAVQAMSNLIVTNEKVTYNGKDVYKVEEGDLTPVFYDDKNTPLKIKTYLFYYSSKNG